MIDPVIRDACFPIHCVNLACRYNHTKEHFIQAIEDNGLVYADCGKVIYQGFNCINCGQTILLEMPRSDPMVDLRQFYILPNAKDGYFNAQEKLYEDKRRGDRSSPLDFEFIFPAWDPTLITEDQVKEYIPATLPDFYDKEVLPYNPYIPYVMDRLEINNRLQEERATQRTYLRRLYPKNSYWFCLLFCTMPGLLLPASLDENNAILSWECSSFYSPSYNQIYKPAMRHILETASGFSIADKVFEKLKETDVRATEEEIEASISEHQLDFYFNFHDTLAELSFCTDFIEQATNFARQIFWKIYYSTCSSIYLSDKREELSKWVNRVEPGKALFVDAPMGLGKSYSIVETLVENPDLSAVIFMPTRKLCENIIESFKRALAHKQGFNCYEISHGREYAKDDEGDIIYDEYGIPVTRFKHEFLREQVYYADGINKYECPHYEEFIERYKKKWIIKKDICGECNIEETCRFRKHTFNAPLSRIVVTTHQQYERLTKNKDIKKWYRHGYHYLYKNGEKIRAKANDRDFFIVDEDIVLSQCYQPIELSKSEFKAFISTITNFLSKYSFDPEKGRKLKNDILVASGQFDNASTTVFIPPTNLGFVIPEDIKRSWEEASTPEEQWFIPDYLDWPGIIPNYPEIIENAIRNGFVVQEYELNQNVINPAFRKKIKKAFLPNPTYYDLNDLPPHVFFDGTKLDERLLRHKLKNVSFEEMTINVPSIWQHRVWQNINSDLPQIKISEDENAGKAFIDGILKAEGPEKKVFMVCSKAIRDAYLEKFVAENYPHCQKVLAHYGNLRGINEAKECNVGVMFGSFIPSDAVEIAMALELLHEEVVPKEISKTYGTFWTWKESKGVRVYKNEYEIIGEMSKALQITEHRQAIARTRYLFHDTDFYILSKKPIDTYELHLREVETHQYRDDLFPPRKPRNDKYDPIKNAVDDWLSKNKNVNATDIYKRYGIRRQTVAKYLKKMADEGLLVKETKTKYKLPEA